MKFVIIATLLLAGCVSRPPMKYSPIVPFVSSGHAGLDRAIADLDRALDNHYMQTALERASYRPVYVGRRGGRWR